MVKRERALLASPYLWVGLAVLASLPLWSGAYYTDIATTTLFYVALALSWNIVGGIMGQLSLGHSLFVAVGAHVGNALFIHYGMNLWLAMLASGVLAALLGWFITWLGFRFRLPHLSFTLITLAFGEIGLLAVLGTDFLGAASGLFLPTGAVDPLNFQFASPTAYYWVMLVVALLPFVANVLILRSKLGYYLRAIRDDEDCAQSMGIDVLRCKSIAMMISAVLCAWTGLAYTQYLRYVDPYYFASPLLVVEIVLFAAIGGLGTVWGPVFGAGLLVPLGAILRGELGGVAPGMHYVIYGALIVLVVRLMPNGLLPGLQKLWRLTRRSAAAPVGRTESSTQAPGCGA